MTFPNNFKKWFLKGLPYLAGIVCTFAIYKLHMNENVDSMLNENNNVLSNGFLTSQIRYHQEFAPFARRPITSWLIEAVSTTFKMKLGRSFVAVNFFFLFFSGILIFHLSKKMGATLKQGIINMICYFFTFSILFAFFPPVFSYDEPVQYCFVFLAFIAFASQKWFFYLVFFTLALISRETTALLLPGLLFLSLKNGNSPNKIGWRSTIRVYGTLVLPIIFYATYLVIFISMNNLWQGTDNEMSKRFSCFLENFENKKNTVETVTSFILTLAIFLYFAVFKLYKSTTAQVTRNYIQAFLISVLVNTPVVILAALARESRLFALPLFFIWPIFAQLLGGEISFSLSFKKLVETIKNWRFTLLFLLCNTLTFWYSFLFYRKVGLGENNYFEEYLFFTFLLISIHFLMNAFRKEDLGNKSAY